VLWDKELLREATRRFVNPDTGEITEDEEGAAHHWHGRQFPNRLVSNMHEAQFHVAQSSSAYIDEPDAMKQWGLHSPAYLLGMMIMPSFIDYEATGSNIIDVVSRAGDAITPNALAVMAYFLRDTRRANPHGMMR